MDNKQSQGLMLGVLCMGLISVGEMFVMDSLVSPNDASVLCQGRYKRLGKYFTGLTISDLKRMDQDAFCTHAERRDPGCIINAGFFEGTHETLPSIDGNVRWFRRISRLWRVSYLRLSWQYER
jgi:hypothetical protein